MEKDAELDKLYRKLPLKMEGFCLDPELITGSLVGLRDMYKCCICCYFLINPRMCSKCQTLYCKRCIYRWTAKNNQKCPMLCGEFIDCEPNVTAKNVLNMIEFRCPSKSENCGNIPYEKIVSHVENCEYVPRAYECSGCFRKYGREHIIFHVNECDFIYIDCKNCSKKIKRLDQALHDSECTIKCEKCESYILFNEKEAHIPECTNMLISNLRSKVKCYESKLEETSERLNETETKYLKMRNKVEELVELLKLNNISVNAKTQDKVIFDKKLEGHSHYVMCLLYIRWGRDKHTIASGSADNTIKLWNTQTGQVINTLIGHTDFVKCLIQMNWNKNECNCGNN